MLAILNKTSSFVFVILFFVVLQGVLKTAFTQTAVTGDRVDIRR